MMPTLGSLFSGVGGIDLGLERGGWECRWQVEIEPARRAVLEAHWPKIKRRDDIGAVRRARELGAVDLVAGGFPCQPVSAAGKRLGKKDERWLWPEFARILRLLRPRLALVENVPGLLARGRGMDDVVGELAAFGYDAEWTSIPAAAVGAPHLRDRVWLVAYAHGAGRRQIPGSSLGDESTDEGRPEEDDHKSHRFAKGARTDADAEVLGREGAGPVEPGQPRGAAEGGRDASHAIRVGLEARGPDGIPAGPFGRHGPPDGVARGPAPHPDRGGRGRQPQGAARPASDAERAGLAVGERDEAEGRPRRESAGGAGGIEGEARVFRPEFLRRSARPGWWLHWAVWPRSHPPLIDETVLLNPDWEDWFMGFPIGWTRPAGKRAARVRALGDAVVPQVAELVGRMILLAMEEGRI